MKKNKQNKNNIQKTKTKPIDDMLENNFGNEEESQKKKRKKKNKIIKNKKSQPTISDDFNSFFELQAGYSSSEEGHTDE